MTKYEQTFERSYALLGKENMEKLKNASVLIFGLGGVGGACLEGLARAGIGHLTLVDNDAFSVSNLNRQILATIETVGKKKVEVAKERVLSINPECIVETKEMFYLPENAEEIDFSKYDFIVDAIDTISAKCEIALRAEKENIPLVSCMGTGAKINPCDFVVSDIYKTEGDALARAMRTKLKKMGVKHLTVVWSKEGSQVPPAEEENGRHIPASLSFVPPVAGYILCSVVVKGLADL